MYTRGGIMALSDTWLKANNGKARAALEERGDRDGMGVRVTPIGKITFQLRYRYHGAPKRLDLGTYPLMSLKEARAEAQRLKAQHEQGHDPKIVRLLEKQAIFQADSVETLFRQSYEAYCIKNKKGHHDILRSFEIHVFPKIGALPAEKVTLHEWLDLLEKHAALRPGITDRILTNAKQMLKWGVKRRLVPANRSRKSARASICRSRRLPVRARCPATKSCVSGAPSSSRAWPRRTSCS